MNERERTRLSKFLSLVLRHEPETIGLTLDAAGWVSVEMLLARLAAYGKHTSREALDEIVATSPKQRFSLSDDGLEIRANQGHSVAVELGYVAVPPPAQLFHGTVAKALEAIEVQGLSMGCGSPMRYLENFLRFWATYSPTHGPTPSPTHGPTRGRIRQFPRLAPLLARGGIRCS